MSEKTSLGLHALLLAASVATVLLVTASLVPQAARGVQLSAKQAQLASVHLPVIFAANYLVKDESRVPLRD